MVHHWPLQAIALGGQVDDAVGRVGERFRGRRAAAAFQVDGGLEQRVAGGRDVQVELGDGRQPRGLFQPTDIVSLYASC